ncbi:hypothetical protein BX286_0876 [Streptomyces sp. 3211.6]|uniref:hypothetical protein n=1 Tax=Streptomyces sp. 3211.6 TaxID=1938845 RepID=UPI000F2C1FC7|nr:hypothetical protein [Streptomyces sp. 3211.6]RKT02956.1 hypothetical protein BX286_0876 [Streptomyces sp. 3211.6]
MARLTETDKARNEAAIRTAMDRILAGSLPPGGKADLKTLAATAGVTRTGFYPKKNRDGTPRPGPYQHLAEEFERRLQELRAAGEIVDPRDAQVERLKQQVDELRKRIATRGLPTRSGAGRRRLSGPVRRIGAPVGRCTRTARPGRRRRHRSTR